MPKPTGQLRLEVLAELVENSGLDLYKGNSKSWVLDCPKCGKDKRLYIRRRDGRFVCWYCRDKTAEGFEGAPEYALALLLDRSIQDLQAQLYGYGHLAKQRIEVRLLSRAGMYQDQEQDYGQEELTPLEDLPTGLTYPLDFLPIDATGAERGLTYLQGRGITKELALEYQLMYDPPHRRVVFPVHSRGVLLGWQARATFPTEFVGKDGSLVKVPKILTTMADGWRDRALMFEHRLEGSPHAVLVEGPVDALKCHLCGGNVASMGKSVSDGQLDRLKAFGVKRLYLAQDPDASAETALLVSRCQGRFELFFMTPQGTGFEDWGAMPPELALECFRQAERIAARRNFASLNENERYRP